MTVFVLRDSSLKSGWGFRIARERRDDGKE